MRGENRGFVMMEIVVAIAVLTVFSAAALSGVVLTLDKTRDSLLEMKVSSDVANIIECTKTHQLESAISFFTGLSAENCKVSESGDAIVYAFYIDEALPESGRYFSALPSGEAGDRLFMMEISSEYQGETLDGYALRFIKVRAYEYKYDVSAGRFVAKEDADGQREIYYELDTSTVSPAA